MSEITDHPTLTDVASREAQNIERLILFTDAVIAIVITLMVLEVKAPHADNDGALLIALKHMWPEYLAVAISFLVIGVYWSRHRQRFQWVRRIDATAVWLNLILLLSICAIPFATAVLAKHPGRVGTILYAVTVAVPALLLSVLWGYLWVKRMIVPDIPSIERRVALIGPLLTAAVFLLSIPVALWDADIAKLSWIVVLVLFIATRVFTAKVQRKAAVVAQD